MSEELGNQALFIPITFLDNIGLFPVMKTIIKNIVKIAETELLKRFAHTLKPPAPEDYLI